MKSLLDFVLCSFFFILGCILSWFFASHLYDLFTLDEYCRKGRGGAKSCINWHDNFWQMLLELGAMSILLLLSLSMIRAPFMSTKPNN